jgi:hypothetical protein
MMKFLVVYHPLISQILTAYICAMNDFCAIALLSALAFLACSCMEGGSGSDRMLSADELKYYDGIGPGPVHQLELSGAPEPLLAEKGKGIFQAKCMACHQWSYERKIGPGLQGITGRRRPEWIMNQMLNPLEMTKHDSLSKELLSIYMVQMVPMDLSHDDALAVLEYFRLRDAQE